MKSCKLTLALLTVSLPCIAQNKPTLTPADYGKWETLGAGTLSPDGKWLAYEIRRTSGSNELRVSAVAGGKTHTVSSCAGAAFSADSRWMACLVGDSEEGGRGGGGGGRGRRASQTKLHLLDLDSEKATVVDDVRAFAFAGGGPYLAFVKFPPAAPAAGNGNAAPAAAPAAGGGRGGRGGRGGGGAGGAATADGERDPVGTVLLVRNLTTGIDTTFGNVTSMAWQDKGSALAMTIGVEGRTGNAIQVFDPQAGSLRVLDSGAALFSSLTWRKDSNDLAAFRSVKDDGYDGEGQILLAWRNGAEKLSTRVEAPQRILSARAPQWSEDGSTVYVGLAPWPKKMEVKRSEDELPTVEVWHWQDEHVVSEQKLTAARDRDRNALAAWHLGSAALVPLSGNPKEDVRLPHAGTRALVLDATPYQDEAMFGRNFTDVYSVDLASGTRTQIAKRLTPPVEFSPGGRYAMNFREGDFWMYDLQTGASHDVTKDSKIGFTNKENDYPVAQKPAYGVAGWTKDDRSAIVYDSYDLWEIFPDGAKPRRLTDGSSEEIRHRYVRVSSTGAAGGGRGGRGGGAGAAEWIDLDKPVYLSLDGRWTKRTGYARLENGKVDRLVFENKSIRSLEKAKNADVYVYESMAWNETPNFYAAGADLKGAKRVSDTNPFAPQYAWGPSQLIDYKNSHGDRLQGALYYPANYEKGKQYPMIVQIYEIESNQIHNWTAPSERATYNPAVWTQHGYFVLRPDIVFKPRDPGISALDCVTSAVKKTLETGMIDAKHVGLTGHSWGGYETTFIVTHSDLFAAGAVGGALTNLSSSVGEIYWNSGTPETNHVEVGQERMQVPLYDDPQSYIRNSATFVANKLAAPLLMEVGDHDGASDWHQDLEFYNVARRAGKPVVMLVYEGENHSVAQKPNQIDYHRRINAWFDHYLKGAPAEDWMVHGITVLEREREMKQSGSPATIPPSTANPGQN